MTYSERTKGEIAIHPTIKNICSPIECFIFLVFLFISLLIFFKASLSALHLSSLQDMTVIFIILFPLSLFSLDTLRREEGGEVGCGALVVV